MRFVGNHIRINHTKVYCCHLFSWPENFSHDLFLLQSSRALNISYFKFKSLSASNRWNIVRDRKLCYNCLKSDHAITDCDMERLCSKCNMKRYTLVHFEPKLPSFRDVSEEQSISVDDTIISSNATPTPRSNMLAKSNVGKPPPRGNVTQSLASLE